MISKAVIAKAAAYREAFQAAQPFKHVCIDKFFTRESADASLRDFPPFERKFAVNEYGEYGGKAVVSNISEISPFYARLYDYLMSREFLDAMTSLTGIDDLHGDPTLFGGGTHENLNGQALDVHVDFNFEIAGGFHRRANLLLYLNREWDPAWGGAIELHSNPRRPEIDEFSQFNVIFNRAVIFETNEYSWHGFRKIHLPEDRLHLSRKCLSIYLYTRDRPAHEIVGPHSTFYVQWPFPAEFKAGHVLSQADVEELSGAYRQRDRQIEMYQLMEERHGRDLDQLRRYLDEVLAATRAPIAGYAQQVGSGSGLFHDGWVTRDVSLRLRADRPISEIAIKGYIPDDFPRVSRAFEIAIDEETFRFTLQANGSFDFSCPTKIPAGTNFALRLRCDADFNASAAGKGGDQRNLSYYLSAIELAHEPKPGGPRQTRRK
ncbi:MAG TPA: 2OG-Fe(II) oxygenase [Stellaceae bacterium]|nr:2OG-Fe(II) oxygenase [Stellaceae bacterium]